MKIHSQTSTPCCICKTSNLRNLFYRPYIVCHACRQVPLSSAACFLSCAVVSPVVSPRSWCIIMSQHCSDLIFIPPSLHALTSKILDVLNQSHTDNQRTRPLATKRRGSRLRMTICSSLTLGHTFSLPSFFYHSIDTCTPRYVEHAGHPLIAT